MPKPAQQAAHILVEHRIHGTQIDSLPEQCRPGDISSGLAIQAAVTELWCEKMDDTVGGWKCGLPSLDKIVLAPIYTRTIDSIPPVALWPKNGRARVEPELAFFFRTDLPPRATPYSPSDVDAAISRTHMALELVNSRYTAPKDRHFSEMLADGLVNQGLFIGPEVNPEFAHTTEEFTIKVTCANGEIVEHQGRHPNGSPRLPLYWLVEFLRERGDGIMAGQAIITGSFAGVIDLPLNTDIHIEYTGLGAMPVHFISKG